MKKKRDKRGKIKYWNIAKSFLKEKEEKKKKWETLWEFILLYLSLLESVNGLSVIVVNPSLCEVNPVSFLMALPYEILSFHYNWKFFIIGGDWGVMLWELKLVPKEEWLMIPKEVKLVVT